MCLALAIKITDVWLGVNTIIALASEHKPTAVVRPTVIGVTLLAVYVAEQVDVVGLQVD